MGDFQRVEEIDGERKRGVRNFGARNGAVNRSRLNIENLSMSKCGKWECAFGWPIMADN